MFSDMILKMTSCVYWDFLSTLSAMLLGIFFTWLFSKHYYSKSNEYFRRLNLLYSEEISKLGQGRFKIVHDEKSMPSRIVFLSGTAKAKTNIKAKLEVVKNKDKNKSN